MMARFGRLIDRVVGAGAWCAAVACAVMMLLVVINAVTRFIWASIPGTLEIVESLMGVVSVMMLAYTQAQKGHIGVELVLSQMPARAQNAINCITLLLALIFALFLAKENWRMGLEAWQAKDFATTYPHVPLYPSKLVVSVGISLLCLQIIAEWLRSIKQLFGNEGANKIT
jgi:TRAP-type mannitol/chloroaromatic compound transport system permease small subunit